MEYLRRGLLDLITKIEQEKDRHQSELNNVENTISQIIGKIDARNLKNDGGNTNAENTVIDCSKYLYFLAQRDPNQAEIIRSNSSNTITPQKDNCTSFKEEDVPKRTNIEYRDGTFRLARKSGLLQYRFMLNGKQASVYGYTKEECWQKRFEFDPDKKPIAHRNEKNSKNETPAHIKVILKDPQKKRLYSKYMIDFMEAEIPPLSEMSDETPYRDWAVRWILSKITLIEPEYANAIAGYLHNDILPYLGKKKLGSIAMLELTDFINSIPKPNKRTKIAAALSESLRAAKSNRLLDHDPYEGVTYLKEEPELKGALTHRDQMLILCGLQQNGRTKLQVFGIVMLLTGMRPGEVLALSSESFDQERKEIIVQKSFSRIRKDTKKPKTDAGARRIPYEDLLLQILEPYLNTSDRIFEEYTNDYVCKLFSKQFEAANISGTAYMFRHSFITNCYELGVPPYVVQRWAGHSKIQQADTYLALRSAKDFIETPIVKYMRALKSRIITN